MAEKPDLDPREVASLRIHIEGEDGLSRRLCSVTFNQADASVYVFPTVTGGAYYFGRYTRPATRHITANVPWRDFLRSEELPHLSIHERGRMHVRNSELTTDPIYLRDLRLMRGDHVATIRADSFDALPPYRKKLKLEGRDRDVVARAPKGFRSARMSLFLNGLEPMFPDPEPQQIVAIGRSTLRYEPLYLGLLTIRDRVTGEPEAPGVTVLGVKDRSPHMLFIRCSPDP